MYTVVCTLSPPQRHEQAHHGADWPGLLVGQPDVQRTGACDVLSFGWNSQGVEAGWL